MLCVSPCSLSSRLLRPVILISRWVTHHLEFSSRLFFFYRCPKRKLSPLWSNWCKNTDCEKYSNLLWPSSVWSCTNSRISSRSVDHYHFPQSSRFYTRKNVPNTSFCPLYQIEVLNISLFYLQRNYCPISTPTSCRKVLTRACTPAAGFSPSSAQHWPYRLPAGNKHNCSLASRENTSKRLPTSCTIFSSQLFSRKFRLHILIRL